MTAGIYVFNVTATENGAESAPSNTVTVTVAPLAPTGLTAQ